MSKYNARRTVVDNLTFDSQAEAMRYCQLKLMQEAGAISALWVHPRFRLQEPFPHKGHMVREITYEADFSYYEGKRQVVEDVKGVRTPVYLLKKKIFMYHYPNIDFREVEA